MSRIVSTVCGVGTGGAGLLMNATVPITECMNSVYGRYHQEILSFLVQGPLLLFEVYGSVNEFFWKPLRQC